MEEGMESLGDLTEKLAHYNQQLEERLGVNSVDASEEQEREQAPSQSRAWSPRRFRLPFRAASSRSKSPSRRVKEPVKNRPKSSSRQLKEHVQVRSSSPSRLSFSRRAQQETTKGQSRSPSLPVKEHARIRPDSPSFRGTRPVQWHSKSPSRRQSPARGNSPRRRVTNDGGERSKRPLKSPSRRHARGERSKSPTKSPSRRTRDREKGRSKSPTKRPSRRESELPRPFSIEVVEVVAVPAEERLDDETSYGHHAASVRASVVARPETQSIDQLPTGQEEMSLEQHSSRHIQEQRSSSPCYGHHAASVRASVVSRQETQSIDQLPTGREEMSLEQHSSRHIQDQRSSSPCRSSSPSRQYTPDARFKETVDSLYSDLLELSVQEQAQKTPPQLNLLDQDDHDYRISFSPPPRVIPITAPSAQHGDETTTSQGGAQHYQETASSPEAMDQLMRVASMRSIDELIDIMEFEEKRNGQAAATTKPAPCDETKASDSTKSEKSWTSSFIGEWDPEKDIRLFYEKYHKRGFVPKKVAAKADATKEKLGFFEALGRYVDDVQRKVCSDVSTAYNQEPPVALRRHGPAN